MIRFLHNNYINYYFDPYQYLCECIRNKDFENFKNYIEKNNIDVEKPIIFFYFQYTLLHFVCVDTHCQTFNNITMKMMKYLIEERKAKIETCDVEGNGLLHTLCWNDANIIFVKYLIERGIFINSTNIEKQTPLYRSIICSCEKLIDLLIQNGGKVMDIEKLILRLFQTEWKEPMKSLIKLPGMKDLNIRDFLKKNSRKTFDEKLIVYFEGLQQQQKQKQQQQQ
jgi:hypothetical protein